MRNLFIAVASALVLLSASIQAAYTTATLAAPIFIDANGALHVPQTLTGDAGEPAVPFEIVIQDPGSAASVASTVGLQNQQKIAALNRNRTLGTGLTVGQAMPVTYTPSTPAVVGASRYIAVATPFTPAATPQDVCAIRGSATATVIVNRSSIATTQTTAGINTWHLIRRSTVNTGGSPTVATVVPVDSLSPAPSAIVANYTANPTLGTTVGRYAVKFVPAPSVTASGNDDLQQELSSAPFPESIVLRGTSELLAWNFAGAALPAGLTVTCSFEWSEQ